MAEPKGPKEWSPRGEPGVPGRITSLAAHLGIPRSDVEDLGDNRFGAGGGEYLVLTDDEADARAKEYIEESLWAFNAGFIIDHSKLPPEAEEMVKFFQEEKCEGANDTIRALIDDMDELVGDAVAADGRGHFLSPYDGEEHEQGRFFIYRVQ